MTLRQHLEVARRQLAGQPDPGLEAEILLAFVLGESRAYLYANSERELPRKAQNEFGKVLEQRRKGEPIAYITGQREFWSLPLRVTPAVLIPRHETELLVETALQLIPEREEWRVADLGTGSGAIALAIASERPLCEIHATDIIKPALDLARENARSLGLASVSFHLGSWCEPLNGKFHVLISNPPYIAADDVHLQQGDVRFEPRDALTPGADPMSAFQIIASSCKDILLDSAWLLFEHGTGQGSDVREILHRNGFGKIETLSDLAGHERVSVGQVE